MAFISSPAFRYVIWRYKHYSFIVIGPGKQVSYTKSKLDAASFQADYRTYCK